MSTPKKIGTGSRRRTAGVALLAIAAVAAVIGLLMAVNHSQRTSELSGPTLSPAPRITEPPRPSIIPFPPVIPSPTEMPPATPPDTGEAAPGGGKVVSRGEVRVYNNSTIRGLAAQAASDLSAAGWTVIEIGNYARGTISTSTVYYQDDADQRAAAEAIATEFGMRVEPRFPGISDARPGIVVIVTNDYHR